VTDAQDPELTPEEARVVGCLVEKQATVPDTYPMTLNGLRGACNQSSNRDPVVSYDDGTVQRALDSLKTKGLVRFVHAAHGSRTTKYRQVLDEALGLGSGELAALSVLLLRGPQTAAEVRARSERQHAFDSVDEVESLLQAMASRPSPLVRLLPREPGRREARWVQLLTGAPDAAGVAGTAGIPGGSSPPSSTWSADPGAADGGEVTALREELAAVREELASMRRRFDELCARLGETDL
jgi:uncharacterized protein